MKRLEFFGLSVVLCMAVLEVRVGALTPRIIGGKSAKEEQFPYQVALIVDGQLVCGASLISHNYILTAAHCVQYNKTTEPVSISSLKVRAGSIYFNSGGVLVDVSEIKIPPSYLQAGESTYDIALLKLATPLSFTKKIKAIELAKVAVKSGKTIVVSGWGDLCVNGPKPTKLQHVKLEVSTDRKCKESYDQRLLESAFCAQCKNKGGCYGDSGGPAVHSGTLVGVISFKKPNNCTRDLPDGFTKISLFRDWIIKNSDLK